MIQRLLRPRGALAPFVECLWLYEGFAAPHAKERTLPTGTVELVINLRTDVTRIYDRDDLDRCEELAGSIVVGAHAEHFVIDTEQQAAVMGVHFKAGGAAPFLGVPAGEVEGRHLPLEAIWGARGRRLRERLLEERDPDARLALLERQLLEVARGKLERDPCVAFALEAFDDVPHLVAISAVTDRVGYSPKRFIQMFRDAVGLTPKLYCRVRRFQAVLDRVGEGRPFRWADVAAACGYSDQAHLVRDFRAFAGIVPSEYTPGAPDRKNHVPIG